MTATRSTPATLTRPLIDARQLLERRDAADEDAAGMPPAPTIVDCRFRLDDPQAGPQAWRRGRIPGSIHLHLDLDLSDPVVPGRTGRHPLPAVAGMRARFAALGIDGERPVAFLDDAGGPFAARAWWLAAWCGHPRAAVVDGGWAAWLAAGGVPDTGAPPAPPAAAAPWPERPALMGIVTADDLLGAMLETPSHARAAPLIDARGRPRFEGRQEPIDPVAGHIPGARCMPFDGNLHSAGDDAGRFLDAAALRERWAPVLGPDPAQAVCYCGSGVTAAHDILAAVIAGLPPPRLYPGSWSEWITDPRRPVATGAEDDETLQFRTA